MNPLHELSILVEEGENTEAVICAEKLLCSRYTVQEIVDATARGLERLRNKCTVENFQLLDVLLASRAMVEVVDECLSRHLQKEMDSLAEGYEQIATAKKKCTMVIGTIKGDVHDLGKHLVATFSRFDNFNVINLGKDIPADKFVAEAIEHNAKIVAVSSLMTVCLSGIKEIKPCLVEAGKPDIIVVGGGAAVMQSSREALNLDFIAQDAFDGLDFFNSVLRQQ